ncbi:MAG: ribosome-binding factor A [Elusimicrobia bacterium RIFCSPHIGHO2_02_FULL_57_9]|nr:MAG: ribosome-binding factor A [Elusimicrobia bacterium RIFCSPHIGHO2_02_FULL_57_9]
MIPRREKLKELFQHELALAVSGVKDPGISGFMTITAVKLSADMKTAFVYYSILGSEQQRASTASALERAAPYLRQVLRKRLTLKNLPQFVFAYDATPEKASRVDKLLLQIAQEHKRK